MPRMMVASITTATARPTPNSFTLRDRERREDREHSDHHDRRTCDCAGGGLDSVLDRVRGAHTAVVRVAYSAEDEHVVVKHEQHQRQPRGDRAVGLEAEQVLAPAVLEHGHDNAVAAATDSRFSTTDLAAITTERNEASSSRNANVSTNPNTIGSELFIAWWPS
jgi:hypothetical protein